MTGAMGMDLKKVLLLLRQHTGIVRMVVSFEGGGDEGNVAEVQLFGPAGKSAEMMDLPAPLIPEFAALNRAQAPGSPPPTLGSMCEALAYQLIQNMVDFDWVNNEGGGGVLEIEPYSGRVFIDAYQNVTTTEQHKYDHSFADDDDFTALSEEERVAVELTMVRNDG